jgi:hypothetical protein
MKQKQESFSDYVTWKLTPLIKILLQYEDWGGKVVTEYNKSWF